MVKRPRKHRLTAELKLSDTPTGSLGPQEIQDLLKRMEITKTIRFTSSLRLRREKKITDVILNSLSFAIAAFSLISLVFAERFSAVQIAVVGTFTVVMSFYIIILNYEFSKRQFDKDINNLELSANEIFEIHLHLGFAIHEFYENGPMEKSDSEHSIAKKYFEMYNTCLKRFQFAHEEKDVDYVLWKYPELRSSGYTITREDSNKVRKRYELSHVYISLIRLSLPVITAMIGIGLLVIFPKP